MHFERKSGMTVKRNELKSAYVPMQIEVISFQDDRLPDIIANSDYDSPGDDMGSDWQ